MPLLVITTLEDTKGAPEATDCVLIQDADGHLKLVPAGAFGGGEGGGIGIPGPQGSPGPSGPAGVKGDKGDPGADSTVPGPAGSIGPIGPAGPASTVPGPVGPAGLPGDTTMKIMNANGVLSGPSVKVMGGTLFTLRSDYMIQNILNGTTAVITLSPPAGFSLVGAATIGSKASGIFQRLDGVQQYQRL